MSTLYTLQLQNSKYYVGTTGDLTARMQEHYVGEGSSWTRLHKPVCVMFSRPTQGPHDENNTTKDLMSKYGIDNVRGGAYSQVELSAAQRDILDKEIKSVDNACYKCGKQNHLAYECGSLPQQRSQVLYQCFACGCLTADLHDHRMRCLREARRRVNRSRVW